MNSHICYARAKGDDTGLCVVLCPGPKAAAEALMECLGPWQDDYPTEVFAWVKGARTGGWYPADPDELTVGPRLRAAAAPRESPAVYATVVYAAKVLDEQPDRCSLQVAPSDVRWVKAPDAAIDLDAIEDVLVAQDVLSVDGVE
jgi:hypothetical protein